MDRNTIIPIFLACDNAFIKFTDVALKSIIENASKDYQYNVHILNTGIDEDKKERTLRLQNENFSIFFEDVTDNIEAIKTRLPLRDYYSLTTYYRIFMADMFPQYDKAIYIDSDTITKKDISELYFTDIGDNYVGAVTCQVVVQSDIFATYAEEVLGVPCEEYFNAGMLLVNCEQFRKNNVQNQFIQLINEYTFVVAQDQDYLNIICKDKVHWLDFKWNAEMVVKPLCSEEEMCILHYNLVAKPWHYKDCIQGKYFWQYAKMTEDYEEIKAILENYTEEERINDRVSHDNLLKLAVSEIQKEDNYLKVVERNAKKSKERLAILEKIEQYEREGRFDEDVEEDPPTIELKPEDIEYLDKRFRSKVYTRYAFKIAHWYVNGLIAKKQLIMKDYIGIEHFKNLNSGAVITCNHFNAFDSFAIHLTYDKAKQKKRKFYRVIREGNYTSFSGFYGVLMRNCNTLPLSSNYETMKKFMSAVDKVLQDGHFVLVYPEQSMWWNYRKPKPLKKGAFLFAAKNNVPVLPCFITMEDSDVLDGDGFPVQEYTVHVCEPIYPKAELSRSENIKYMMEQNAEAWKKVYEETYKMPLKYTCDEQCLKNRA